MSAKKLIVVMGPHRSGTSLCTHAIEVLGAQTGLREIYASDENSKGFFEHQEMVRFNEKLLHMLGGSWDNPVFDTAAAIAATDLRSWSVQAETLMQSLFGGAECIVLKDPRMCQLLPFWEPVFEACGYAREHIRYVHVLRNPVEVARSQQARVERNPDYYEFGRNIEEGAALWLSLTRQSLEATRGRRNYPVAYQDLLDNPREELLALAAFLELTPDAEAIDDFCDRFVDNRLHRSKGNAADKTVLEQHIPAVFAGYEALAESPRHQPLTDAYIDTVLEAMRQAGAQQSLLRIQAQATPRLEKRGIHGDFLCNGVAPPESNAGWIGKARHALQTLPLKIWLHLRGSLVRLYMRISCRFPRQAQALHRAATPCIRLLDRLTFRLSAAATRNTAKKNVSLQRQYQQAGMPVEDEPLVTVIVPNYNHAAYLEQRLDSIYGQSYRNVEVILMDDCSQDDSVRILTEYQQRYPERTRLVLNGKNSGGVFYQWEKGIALAKGNIIWIAESDDYCSGNFLETLVPMFRNEAVMLAYARTEFVRNREPEPFWSLNAYLHDINPAKWEQPFADTAARIVPEAFAIKNIIPNVSSALFRKPVQLEILHDNEWKKMRTCGDWALYLHLIRGGMLAYSPAATNYYRLHGQNTSVGSYTSDSFYQEHEYIARLARRYFDVPMAVLERQEQQLLQHWKQHRPTDTMEQFSACYDLQRVEQDGQERAINLLMAGYGMSAGGGETFPIFLANLMKAQGYNVTFLDCNQTARNPAIRQKLRNDIAIVSNLEELNDIARDFSIDVIHSHHSWVDSSLLHLLRPETRAATVVTMHGMYELMEPQDAGHILPALTKQTAEIVYTAEKNLGAVKAHQLYDPDKMTRIDNALERYPFEPLEKQGIGIPDDAFVLTLVSRAVPEKGWHEAVQAVAHARTRSTRDIRLVLIGEGPAYDALKRNGVEDFIHLQGFRDNIRSYFAASELCFLPTRFKGESFPLVLIDAFHAGTPVLASAVGEIPYMLETAHGKAGVLFELDEDGGIDTEALGTLIAALAEDAEGYQELKKNAATAAEKFDPERLCAEYGAVYQRAVKKVA